MRRFRLVAPLALVVTLLACGGGPALTAEAYASKAGAICEESARDLARLPAADGLSGWDKLAARRRPILVDRLKDLRKLNPPRSDAPTLKPVWAAADKAIDALDAARKIPSDSETAKTKAISAYLNQSNEAYVGLRDYGVGECGLEDQVFPKLVESTRQDMAASLGVSLRDNEVECMSAYVIASVRIDRVFAANDPLLQSVGREAAVTCLSSARIVEIGNAKNSLTTTTTTASTVGRLRLPGFADPGRIGGAA